MRARTFASLAIPAIAPFVAGAFLGGNKREATPPRRVGRSQRSSARRARESATFTKATGAT